MAFLAAVGLAACATRPSEPTAAAARTIPERLFCETEETEQGGPDPGAAEHVLAVDVQGNVIDPWAPEGQADRLNFVDHVRAIFRAYVGYHDERRRLGQPARLLFFVNGGLNGRYTTLRRAAEQAPCMRRAGYFPIFLVWRSAFFDAYWQQISRVRNGRVYRDARPTTPIYLLADIGQGIARAPATYLNMLGNFLETVEASLDSLLSRPDPEKFTGTTPLAVHYDGPEQTVERFAENATLFAVTAPLKFLTTPFADAFGQTAWENMVRRTRNTLRRPQEFEADRRDLAEMARYPKGTGGFAKLFAELERCVRGESDCVVADRRDAFADVEITLIAHSMGAIILNDLIRTYDEVPYRDVVYMGAACSIRHFLGTVAPVMEMQPALRFYNLMLHPVADGREVTGYGLMPSGSLLEWVDEMYEGPPTILDRTLGKWVNVEAAAHVFPAHLRDRLHFRVFGFRSPDPERRDPGDPTAHGDFNDTNMHYWLPDFWDGQRPPAGRELASGPAHGL